MLIAALSMMGPFAIDTYLPAFREIESSLGATPLQVQQSLTAYLIPFAFMTLWHGSISDALGRRLVIIVALGIVTLASIGCALAPNIETFLAFRAIQGFASGIFVVGRAVVRDVYSGPMAQRVISQVSVLFALGPAFAPIIGGWLHEVFGWRSIFVFITLFSGGVMAWSAISLPETLPQEHRQPLHPSHLGRSYWRSFTHPAFLLSALAAALNFTAMFIYIAGAPALLLQHLHVKETQFFWLFGPITAGMMLGGALSGRLAGKLDLRHTLAWSYVAMGLATIANVAFHFWNPAALPWSVIPLFFYAVGMSLSLPTLTLFGLDLFPKQRGLASSCQAFVLTGANALNAGLITPAALHSPLCMAVTSAVLMVIGLGCALFSQSLVVKGAGSAE